MQKKIDIVSNESKKLKAQDSREVTLLDKLRKKEQLETELMKSVN